MKNECMCTASPTMLSILKKKEETKKAFIADVDWATDEVHNSVKEAENGSSPPEMTPDAPPDPTSITATENPDDFPPPLDSAVIPLQDTQEVTSFSSDKIGLKQTTDPIENMDLSMEFTDRPDSQVCNLESDSIDYNHVPEGSNCNLEPDSSDYNLDSDDSSDYNLEPDDSSDYNLEPDDSSDYDLESDDRSDCELEPNSRNCNLEPDYVSDSDDEVHNCVKEPENSLSPPQMTPVAPTDPASVTATENPDDFPQPSAMIPPPDTQVVTSFSSDDIGLQQTTDPIENMDLPMDITDPPDSLGCKLKPDSPDSNLELKYPDCNLKPDSNDCNIEPDSQDSNREPDSHDCNIEPDYISDSAESAVSVTWPMLEQKEQKDGREADIEKIFDKDYPSIYVRKVVYAPTFNNKRKKNDRVQNTCHACFFCKKLVAHIQDHLNRMHGSQEEVRCITECTDNERKEKLKALLRAKGDHKHNRKVVQEKSGELLLFRRPTERFMHDKFGPCIECFEWMKTTSIPKHLKTCKGDKTNSIAKIRYVTTMSGIAKGKKTYNASDILIKEVFTIMSTDTVGLVAREDELICALGENWLRSCIDNKVKRSYWASQHMRLAAKLLMQVRSLDEDNDGTDKSIWEFLRPAYFDNIVTAALNISLPDIDDVEELKSPSNAIKIKYDLIRMLEYKSEKSSQMFDKSGEEKWKKFRKDAEAVLTGVQRLWKTKITKLARKVLLERKLGKRERLPIPGDIEKLGRNMRQELVEADLDKDNITWIEFKRLAEYSQARLLTYNKRRSGEIEGITLKNYRHKLRIDDLDEGLIGEITQLERYLMDTHDLIQTRGKKNAIVPVLIPQECRPVLEFLADSEVRRKLKVPVSNLYLFPKQLDQGPIRAYDSLKKVCRESQLTEPESITSTTLRKYMATLSQVLNLTPTELQQMCRHLGHTTKVHLTHYRTMSPLIERVNLGKVLLMQDLNLQSKFVGKELNEIDFYEIIKPSSVAEETEEDQSIAANEDPEPSNPVAENETELESDDAPVSDIEDDVAQAKPKMKKVKRQRWTSEEEKELRKYFEKNFKSRVTPRMAEVLKAKRASLKDGGSIHRRFWHLIVKKVSAIIQKDKRNQKK